MKYSRDTKVYMSIFDLIPRDDVSGWAKHYYQCLPPATYPPSLWVGRGLGCLRCGADIFVGHMCADVAEYMTTDAWQETKKGLERELIIKTIPEETRIAIGSYLLPVLDEKTEEDDETQD